MPSPKNFPHRLMTSRFLVERDARTTPVGAKSGRHVLVRADRAHILVDAATGELWLEESPSPGLVYVGESHGRSVWASPLEGAHDTAAELRPLRSARAAFSEAQGNLALTAVGMLQWHRDYVYCPTCGQRVQPRNRGWVLECPEGHQGFPRTDPAVIVAVTDAEDRLLLARNIRSTGGMMSVLAGFVEPGENLESALVREVFEETGLRIENCTYWGSQPWPMPRSLMLAFTATLAPGSSPEDLTLQEDELVDAAWFTRAEFRTALESGSLVIPDEASIARHLINDWEARA